MADHQGGLGEGTVHGSEIQERLASATRWTYSTVRTLMDRMVGKGLLAATKQGKVTAFRSLIARQDARVGGVVVCAERLRWGADADGAVPDRGE